MIPEIGHFTLIIAFFLALALGVLPLVGLFNGQVALQRMSRSLAVGLFFFLAVGLGFLVASFVGDDFTVKYVASNSNSLLPIQYKVSAVWGGHEGSLLLWVFLLSGWILAVALFSRTLPLDMVATVLACMGIIAAGFLAFMLLTSNPFDRELLNTAADGADLNPLLQDIGLILHPPLLYMGYVGFAVAFGFALAALITGRMDTAWARWARPWTNLAWVFLTLGISLGSWWAYYELGWGGWWFWDPVENASFMPWLVGTALIHSLAVTEKRGAFRAWTVLLALFAFSYSLLGTFLVRSGVLTSVHSFASDPSRGYFILSLLGLTLSTAFILFAFRADKIVQKVEFSFFSRDAFLLYNNLLLTLASAFILTGTLMPIVYDIMGMRTISVGAPWFNKGFVPITLLLLALLGVGQLLRWKKHQQANLTQQLLVSFAIAAVLSVGVTFVYGDAFNYQVALGLLLAFWVVVSLVNSLLTNTKNANSFVLGLKKLTPSYWGMFLAHAGVVISLVGATMVSNYDFKKSFKLSPGDEVTLGKYNFTFEGVEPVVGPNYMSEQGRFVVEKGGKTVATLLPEKRFYSVARNTMTEAGIDPGFTRDLYISLGEKLDENGTWSVNLQVKPFMRWLWVGTIFMAIGGVVSLFDKRYRKQKTKGAVA